MFLIFPTIHTGVYNRRAPLEPTTARAIFMCTLTLRPPLNSGIINIFITTRVTIERNHGGWKPFSRLNQSWPETQSVEGAEQHWDEAKQLDSNINVTV